MPRSGARLTLQLAGCTWIEALQLGIDDSQGAWSGPDDSPRIAASVIDALPNLQELVLLDIRRRDVPGFGANAESHALLSAAVWRLSQLHTLTMDRSKLLNAPSATSTRPPITNLVFQSTASAGRWRWNSNSAPLENPPDALVEAFAGTLEELVSALQPKGAVLRSATRAALFD